MGSGEENQGQRRYLASYQVPLLPNVILWVRKGKETSEIGQARLVGLEKAMTERYRKRQEQEREATVEFYEKHPGWHLLQVSKCPAPGCGKRLYCEKHQYACRQWWVNLTIGLIR